MDYNISRWLKDDLGAMEMCEADFNSLMFHPRHGNVCRKIVKFLAESTVCNKKYPHIYAKEEHQEAANELKQKNEELSEVIRQIEDYVREQVNEELELDFLKSRLAHLRHIEELQRTSAEALQEIVNRPNLGLEQIARTIDQLDCLSKSDLADVNSTVTELRNLDNIVTARQMASLDDELNDLVRKINIMNRAIGKLLQGIIIKMNNMDENLKPLETTNVQNLLSLKVPEVEEIIVDLDPDEQELRSINLELSEKVRELNQQVIELSDRYKTHIQTHNKAHKEELESILKNLQEIEDVILVDK